MVDFQSLIERLEKAEGPSDRLDLDIWCTTNPAGCTGPMPRFTHSLDAAVSLVPEGAEKWSVSGGTSATEWGATVDLPDCLGLIAADFKGATPALALCIAALKAIQSQRKETERE